MNRLDSEIPPRKRVGLEALTLLSKKWNPVVLVALSHNGPSGFNELQDIIEGVSGKVLTETLDALQESELITRREVSDSPLRVEYELTGAGRDLELVFEALSEWGDRHLENAIPRVLVADGDRRLTRLYGQWMSDRYSSVRTHNRDQFFTHFEENVDVVILDAQLPGIEIHELIGEIRSECRTIVLVGDRPEFGLLTVPCDDLLRKPIRRETVLTAVENQLTHDDDSIAERDEIALTNRMAVFESVYSPERLATSTTYRECRDSLSRG
ncbi:winged helix-turn-helix transcriptional regulator [Halobellus captivus]|uniref:winged helix-turn-helix transcriptional regulator n=1 Tax=Halobellus captivus TaxID=2592614 RepID=UPI00119EFF33|nr:winged helix-turn-helix transcriptional regulator [Halobellus captivus]